MQAVSADDPDQAGYLVHLAEALQLWSKEAEALPPSTPTGWEPLSNLAYALLQRAIRTEAPEELDKVVALCRQIVQIIPVGHPDRAKRLSNLAVALEMRYDLAGASADQDEPAGRGLGLAWSGTFPHGRVRSVDHVTFLSDLSGQDRQTCTLSRSTSATVGPSRRRRVRRPSRKDHVLRQKAARFGVTLAMAGTLAAGVLAAATPASATATGWAPYQGYRTLQNCVSAGTAKLVMSGYKEYDCRWDSPYYMLWLRK